jgi:hypothetical protein
MSCTQNEVFYEYCDEQGIDPETVGDSYDLDSETREGE